MNSELQSVGAQQATAHRHHGFQSAGSILRSLPGDLVVSKQKLRRAEAIAYVRLKRQEANQNLGFASRLFVLCGLYTRSSYYWAADLQDVQFSSYKAKRGT